MSNVRYLLEISVVTGRYDKSLVTRLSDVRCKMLDICLIYLWWQGCMIYLWWQGCLIYLWWQGCRRYLWWHGCQMCHTDRLIICDQWHGQYVRWSGLIGTPPNWLSDLHQTGCQIASDLATGCWAAVISHGTTSLSCQLSLSKKPQLPLVQQASAIMVQEASAVNGPKSLSCHWPNKPHLS